MGEIYLLIISVMIPFVRACYVDGLESVFSIQIERNESFNPNL